MALMIKPWVGKTRLSFNWTTNALGTPTCFSPFVWDQPNIFSYIKPTRSFLVWIINRKGKGRKVKISLSTSSSHSIFQRAQLARNFSHSPMTSCKIILPHIQVIKQNSSFHTQSAQCPWSQDKSHPATHTTSAYLEKNDISATTAESHAVNAMCPRLWGVHVKENSASPALHCFSAQVMQKNCCP